MDKLIITLVQSNLIWENTQDNLVNFTQIINNIQEHTHIIVLPETFTSGFSMNPLIAQTMSGEGITWMKKMAQEKKVIVTGSLFIEENGKYYNRLVWMQPDGQFHFYNKRHLFSYAGEDAHFNAGNAKVVVQVGGWKIRLNICYDLRFPIWSRQEKENPYDILLYVANWPSQRIVAWDTLLKARAIENLSYVVACNRIGSDSNAIQYNGHSQIIDPLGNSLCCLENEMTSTITLDKSTIEEARQKFSFLQDADEYVLV